MSGEAELTFKLGRRAMLRWQPEVERLRQLAAGRSPGQRRQALMEAQLALDQVDVFVRRIQPLLRAPEGAVRQEAQALLAGIDALKDRLCGIADGVSANNRGDIVPRAAGAVPPRQLRDASGGQVTRFEPRYLDHLIGRRPDGPGPAAQAPVVFEAAYRMWLQDGQPAGRADVYWRQALEQHWHERAWESGSGIDAVPAARLRLEASAAPPPVAPVEEEAAGAFADLAATLESLVADDAAVAPSPAPEPEVPPRRQRARFVKGQGIVWTGASGAGVPPAPGRPPPKRAPLRPSKAPAGGRKKGWGGA